MPSSYYESICAKKGIRIPLMARYAREADKAEAIKRKKLLQEISK